MPFDQDQRVRRRPEPRRVRVEHAHVLGADLVGVEVEVDVAQPGGRDEFLRGRRHARGGHDAFVRRLRGDRGARGLARGCREIGLPARRRGPTPGGGDQENQQREDAYRRHAHRSCKRGARPQARAESTFRSSRRPRAHGIPTTVGQGCPAPVGPSPPFTGSSGPARVALGLLRDRSRVLQGARLRFRRDARGR